MAAIDVTRRAAHYPSLPQDDASLETGDRVLLAASCALLAIVFISGGSSQENGWGVMVAELLALPLLLCVPLRQDWRQRLDAARWPLAIACAIAALPVLQLLPMPAWLWQWPSPRLALAHDLASAGVNTINQRWSLAPEATERDVYLLLPSIALFVATLALPRRAWRLLLWWMLALVAFSLALAFAQLGVPQDSFLNPFPQYAPMLAGVFANRNHQACALAMALVASLALAFGARTRVRFDRAANVQIFACAILATISAAVLPLVGSRAGVIIGVVGVAATLLACGPWSPRQLRERHASRWSLALAIAILALGLYGALAWMQVDADIEGSRWDIAVATTHLAAANMPFGSGFGSFVRMFEQGTRGALMHQGYINAAHDDYLQWWMEGGLPAIVAMLAAAWVLITAAIDLLRLPRESSLRNAGMAALLAIFVPVLHSTVDYPLRTPALMATFGMLAGITVAAALRARRHHAVATAAGDHSRNRPTPAHSLRHNAPSAPPRAP